LPQDVHGIAFREDNSVQVRDAVLEDDLDWLPLPAWDLMNPLNYPDEAAGIFVPAFPAAPVMLSRGCSFKCAYCGCRYISGTRIRYRPVESILEEIDLLERDYGSGHLPS
jgi:anaerobic magnesium-protoporphyrin IX monomethyl ester cyclase